MTRPPRLRYHHHRKRRRQACRAGRALLVRPWLATPRQPTPLPLPAHPPFLFLQSPPVRPVFLRPASTTLGKRHLAGIPESLSLVVAATASQISTTDGGSRRASSRPAERVGTRRGEGASQSRRRRRRLPTPPFAPRCWYPRWRRGGRFSLSCPCHFCCGRWRRTARSRRPSPRRSAPNPDRGLRRLCQRKRGSLPGTWRACPR